MDCGEESHDQSKPAERVYSLSKDSKYIHAAMMNKANGIDLDQCDNMHWWTFMAHFMDMGESTFSRIVYLRRQFQKKKLTKEERLECEHIGWDVIQMRSDKEIKTNEVSIFEDGI